MTYPAKLLLFGEHTVNLGSQALAIPLWRYGGQWRFLEKKEMHERAARQMELPQFAEHLFRLRQNGDLPEDFKVEKFREDLAAGLVFESDIPTGYGAGSSGALVAAVFDMYMADVSDLSGFSQRDSFGANLSGLKQAFAKMESFFHGKSSGTDPLVCFLQKPVLLSINEVKTIAPPSHQSPCLTDRQAVTTHQFFLIDTGIPRQATPFIEYFLEKSRDAVFLKKCAAGLLPAVDAGIAAYLSGETEDLLDAVHRIGSFQLKYLEKIIPPTFHQIWREGQSGNLFKLKVCGAGGGGFILGFTRDFAHMKMVYPELRLVRVD